MNEDINETTDEELLQVLTEFSREQWKRLANEVGEEKARALLDKFIDETIERSKNPS